MNAAQVTRPSVVPSTVHSCQKDTKPHPEAKRAPRPPKAIAVSAAFQPKVRESTWLRAAIECTDCVRGELVLEVSYQSRRELLHALPVIHDALCELPSYELQSVVRTVERVSSPVLAHVFDANTFPRRRRRS